MGLWDRLRGERKRTLERNAREAEVARQRDKTEREGLTASQLAQRRDLVKERVQEREVNKVVTRELTEDAKVFRNMEADADAARERSRNEGGRRNAPVAAHGRAKVQRRKDDAGSAEREAHGYLDDCGQTVGSGSRHRA